jgi:ferredoxin-NADP reductase
MPSERDGPGKVKSRSGHPKLSRATIVRRKDFTDDLFLLWLEPESQFHFEPGQYITIGVDGVERPYSIASAPYEPLIELFIERVPPEQGGTLTPILHARRVGDRVTMRPQARGRFTLRANVTHRVMVATVTGVAPYVSMVRQSLHDRAADTGGYAGHRFFVMILEECLIRWSPPKEDTVVYLCGNPGMIDDAKARLLPRGWSVAQIERDGERS